MKKYMTLAALTFLFGLAVMQAGEPDLLKYVNTLQGTNSSFGFSRGNTYPTIAVPYPMHAFSPQTGKNGDGWKYQYAATTIRGFQQAHQCSPWVNDYAVFSLMPVEGRLEVGEEMRAATFSHENELARPHYYRVRFDNGITAEVSPSERCGHMRFTFPKGKEAWLVFDGYTGTSRVEIDEENQRITGYVRNGNLIPGNFRCYFVLEFDQPFRAFGTWENRNNEVTPGNATAEGEGAGAYVRFARGAKVQVKTASSYISPAQAVLNLKQEIGTHASLEDTMEEAARLWNTLLSRVLVEGGSEEEMATFYSCLFRANLFSHKFYEIDSTGTPCYYSPYDGQIHKGYMFTDNGFWDTFRSQFPLTNILHPTMQGRYMQSLLDAQEQCGWLPTWSCPGPSGIMIGNHAISLLADAWAKGIREFDPEQALKAYFHEITGVSPWRGSSGREDFEDYFQLGYIPYPEVGEATAKTLEYAYDDFCAYTLARAVGNDFYAQVFGRQMYNYKYVWDPSVGFVRGRLKDGSWRPGFNPYEWGGPFTEGNAFQYSWSVFHDIRGLIGLMGGEAAFGAKLDSLFEGPPVYDVGTYGRVIHEMEEMVQANMGQYAHGNQPVQHVSYLYNYIRQPWKTQARVREIMRKLYDASENGFPGDEDQGGLSSWYVLSALGIYSVCPGTDQYVLGSPVFRKATIRLENGNEFVIEASRNSPRNVYIRSATLNGEPYTLNWITYGDIAEGGVLHLEMSDQPNTERGTGDGDLPYSLSSASTTQPAPEVSTPGQMAGNPVLKGWYADPEGTIFDGKYWIYPTYSAPYGEQVFLDAFSSRDLVTWEKHMHIIDTAAVKWAKRAMWAPAIIRKGSNYFLFFAANDIQNDEEAGGIGIGISDSPEGPFKDYLGKPLLDKFHNGAQPIDQFVFQDPDGSYYMIYGGWRHCNLARLKDDFTGFIPFQDGTLFKEITPEGYVEGPFMFMRNGKYYFMWSEGGWTGPDYSVAYAIADSPFGPFRRIGKILEQDPGVATGAGHHSVIYVPDADMYYIVYHRRPLGETDGNHRVVCIDRLYFDGEGYIQPVKITFEGVQRRPLE